MSKVVADLRYSDDHEWVASNDAGSARVGVSAIAADALGDIVYVDLPELGSAITAGEPCGEVESTKSVSDLYAPVTGKVVAVNPDVLDEPALVNSDPYGNGWLFEVHTESEGPLMSAQEYAAKHGGEL